MRARRVLGVAAATLGLLGVPATAEAGTASVCRPIHAHGVGLASADGATTTATIRGGGPLTGTTAGAFRPAGVSGTVVSVVGTVVFTPVPGRGDPVASRLDTEVTATIDTATGRFRAETFRISGGGRLAGATGSLVLQGVQDATGHFTETVTGSLCVPRTP